MMIEEEYNKWIDDFLDMELEHDIKMLEKKLKHEIEMDKWPHRWMALFIISLGVFTYWLVKVLTQ